MSEARARGAKRSGRRLAVLAAAVACGLLPTSASTAGGDRVDARLAFRMHDDRVTESSGLALSRTHRGLAYTVNDSGDEARVLVVSMRDGAVVGETRLLGVEAEDVEALAPAPGGRLVVADIGDNGGGREAVEIYVVDEPARGVRARTPRRVSLTYPGGPRDAEAVVVVGRRVVLVSKGIFGGAVYSAPVFGSSHDAYGLRRVGPAPSLVTDAAQLDDGDVVLRDYHRAYVVDPPRWSERSSYSLPQVQQGETVAAAGDGRVVYVGSEGEDSPVFVLALPDSRPERAAATQAQPGAAAAGDTEAAGPSEPADREQPRARPAGYIVVVAAAMVVTLLVRRRRRHRGRRR